MKKANLKKIKSIVNTTNNNMNKSKPGNWIKGVSRQWKALKAKATKKNMHNETIFDFSVF